MAFKYRRCTILEGTNSETDHYLVTAEDRERLSARKQPARKSDVERFNLKKPSEMEVMKQFQIELPNRFVVLENLNDSEDIKRVWEDINENITS